MLFQDGNQDVDGDGYPHLRLYGVLAGPKERLDPQVLLDPFEEQFHLPTSAVEVGNCQSRQHLVVGQEDQTFACFRIREANAAQDIGILLGGAKPRERHRLIESQASLFVHRARIPSKEFGVPLATGDEKRAMLMYTVEPLKVQIATIHDVKRTRIERHLVEDVDVVNLAGRNNNNGRIVSLQRQQRVQFDRRLGSSKLRPWKQLQAQIDGGRVQRIGSLFQIDAKLFADIQVGRLSNEHLRKIGEDAPVPFLVGIRQRTARPGRTNTRVIEFCRLRAKSNRNLPQACAARQLRECHDQELIPATQVADAVVATVLFDASVELVLRQVVRQLCKDRSSFVHAVSPLGLSRGKPLPKAA